MGDETEFGGVRSDRAPGAVPILTYHSLDDSRSVISTPPAVFRRQMEAFRARGFSGISLGTLLRAWCKGTSLPSRPMVVTFDDGYGNVLEHAAGVLREFHYGATVFAVTEYCGKENDWAGQLPEVPRMPLLSWSGLKEWCAAGFEIGSHTLTHPDLSAISRERATREIVASKSVLEDRLGQPVVTFAYPYGLADRVARDTVARTYDGACSVEHSKARCTDDPHWLPRLDMFYLRGERLSGMVGGRLADAYLRVRGLGRTIRAALSKKNAKP